MSSKFPVKNTSRGTLTKRGPLHLSKDQNCETNGLRISLRVDSRTVGKSPMRSSSSSQLVKLVQLTSLTSTTALNGYATTRVKCQCRNGPWSFSLFSGGVPRIFPFKFYENLRIEIFFSDTAFKFFFAMRLVPLIILLQRMKKKSEGDLKICLCNSHDLSVISNFYPIIWIYTMKLLLKSSFHYLFLLLFFLF